MQCLAAQAADRFAEAPALVDHLRSISYREYDAMVARVGQRLKDVGVSVGSRVGIVLPKGVDQIVLLMALMRLRAVACPISTRLPHTGVEACLRRVDASLLITDSTTPRIETCRSVDIADVIGTSGAGVTTEEDISLDQPAVVVFTSGSTGEPKAVLLTLGNLYYNALGSNQNIPFGPEDRWLLSLPLYHVGGLGILFRALTGGGAVVIDRSGAELPETVTRQKITHLSLVSTQLYRLLSSVDKRQYSLGGLKALLLGGSGMSRELMRRGHDMAWPIHTSYGLTEMGSQVTTTPPSSQLETLYTSGRILPYRQLRVNGSGEIEVRGETRFAGYVNGQTLMTPFDADGWFATGDVGSLDADGFLTVKGRKDTMFISGGENIYPEEIERTLCLIDGIEEALVVPVPIAEYGFRPCAFVRSVRPLDPNVMRDLLRESLPSFKIPDRIFPWPSGAVSAGLKPDRSSFRLLAERLCLPGH